MKSCPSLALPNFDVPFSFIYPGAKINEVLYIFDGFSGATLEISHLISQIQSHDLSFANINEQPYVGFGRFYTVKELSGRPDNL